MARICPPSQGFSGAIKKELGAEKLNRAWSFVVLDTAIDKPQAGWSALFLARVPGVGSSVITNQACKGLAGKLQEGNRTGHWCP